MSAATKRVDDDEVDEAEVEASEREIWGDRAESLVGAMSVMSRPIKKATLVNFANRKGWAMPTLEGLLGYCERAKQVEAYRGFNGQPCYRLAGEKDAPPEEADDDGGDVAAAGAVRAPGSTCLCARTAPAANYGCPDHGGARATTTTKETTMAKEWITTAEAGELLGVSNNRVCVRIKEKAIEAKEDDSFVGGGRKPFLIKRASVIAFLEKKQRGEKTPKTPPQREPKAIAAKVARKPAAAPPRSAATGDLVEDVRALLRNVERGWMTTDAMLGHLRELVG